MFNPFSEKPHSNSFLDPDKFKKFRDLYIFDNQLGTGLNGTTFSLINKENEEDIIAVKLMLANKDSFNETNINGNLGILKNDTEIFTSSLGWLIYNEVPDRWKFFLQDLNAAVDLKKQINNDCCRFLYLVMELNSCSLRDLQDVTKEELIQFLFMLLHGIYVAVRKYPYFRHRDIHGENVMVQRLDNPRDIVLKMPNDKLYIIHGVKYIPKLIDFGETRLSKKGHPDDNPREEVECFKDNDGKVFKSRNDINRIRAVIAWKIKSIGKKDEQILDFFINDTFDMLTKCRFVNLVKLEEILKDDFFKSYGIYSEIIPKLKKIKL
jgi:serine/threonine protein kinase